MEIVILASASEIGVVGAEIIERLIRGRPNAVLGLATGSSPLDVYRDLIRRHRDGGLSFRAVTSFLVDEYVGLSPDHPSSYRRYINEHFATHVDLPQAQLHGPNGLAEDLIGEGERYESAIQAAGGVDLQLLGLGTNGHIGFNEPGSSLQSCTRVKTLTAQTRLDNARYFSSVDEVPAHVLTQGIGTILRARHVLLVAVGEAKAEPVARAVEGPVTAMVPGSALQLHPRVTALVDEAAASRLQLAQYYRDTYAAKPS